MLKFLKKKQSPHPATVSVSACPLEGLCRVNNLVYQATVIPMNTQTDVQTYIGMTSTEFKDRYRNHTKSFRNRQYKSETTLSQHIWDLKDRGLQLDKDFKISWKIVDRSRKNFNPVTGVCALCTLEKYYIIFHSELASLNKNDEIRKPCIHRKHLLLDNT